MFVASQVIAKNMAAAAHFVESATFVYDRANIADFDPLELAC
jgi:hypothetical protein